MSYLEQIDERIYNGSSYPAGQLDVRSNIYQISGSFGQLVEGQWAYGELTWINGYFWGLNNDVDIYHLGSITSGTYTVSVMDFTWDSGNPDYGNVASFSLLDSSGAILFSQNDTSRNFEFEVLTTNDFYISISGPDYVDSQYAITYYRSENPIENNSADFRESQIYGSLVAGSSISVEIIYSDLDGNSDGQVDISWYIDGEFEVTTDISNSFTLMAGHVGKIISYRFTFIDDLENPEVSGFYVAGIVESDQALVNPEYDFNGGGTSDLLWRNESTGNVAIWELEGGTKTSYGIGSAGLTWQIEGAGDFNADGVDDLAWRNTDTGAVALWTLDGDGGKSTSGIGGAGLAWQIEDVGDFNADGVDDFLWWNTSTGAVAIWELDGGGGKSTYGIGGAGLSWQIEGVGDFNGDGVDDLAWRNTDTGGVAIWELDGSGGKSTSGIGGAGLVWQIEGIGDFNGDGVDDFLWRNTDTGAAAIWELDGSGGKSTAVIGAAGLLWEINGTGDYNGDGIDDIAWRNTDTGAVAIWDLDGDGGYASRIVGGAGAEWQIFAPDADYFAM